MTMSRWFSIAVLLVGCGCGARSPGSSYLDGQVPGDGGLTDSQAPDNDALPDGTIPELGCLPPLSHGGLIAASGFMSLYHGCGTGDFLMEHQGAEITTDYDGITALRAEADSAIMAIGGIIGVATGLCCPGSDIQDLCVSLMVSANTTSPEDLLNPIGDIFAGSDACFGLRVSIIGATEPRCEDTDPGCVPAPMCPVATDPDCCPAVPEYDPNATRTPIEGIYSGLSSLGQCGHDGECVRGGCGNHCVAYHEPGFVAICPCYPALAEAFCGCLDEQCRWFLLE